MKRVLIVSQVIPQWYVDTLCAALGEDTQVDIITGSTVSGGNVTVIPSPQHDPRSMRSRLVCWYKHWVFLSRWAKKNRKICYDMIFAVSNPPVNSFLGLKLKKRFHAPFVYMNWDLYPQLIAYSIRNPLVQAVCRMWSRWNRRHYPEIDRMLTIGNVMAKSACDGSELDVDVIPIAVDCKRLTPIAKADNPFCRQYDLCDKFVVLYSGKMGRGHNIDVILEAATKLKERQDIRFVFIGEGERYADVEAFVDTYDGDNVLLLPLQSEEVFPYSMACGDIGIVSQEETMAHLFMPSKTYSMMACGQAIVGVCTQDDDLYRLIDARSIGRAVTNNKADELVSVIEELYGNAEKLNACKETARSVAEKEYDLSVITEKYRRLFANVMGVTKDESVVR